MRLLRKIIVIGLCSNLWIACTTTPPVQKPPVSVKEVVKAPLPSTPTPAPATKSESATVPITELPRSQPKPLKQVNQAGQVPTTTTLTETTLATADINLSDKEEIKLDFEQTDLRQIIEIIADSLGISMVIDPTIGDKVTLRTSPDKPLKKNDLWPLLQLLLNDAGITMAKRGNVYHLKKIAPTLPGNISLSPETLTRSDSPEVMQITPLRFIAAESAQAILNPLVQPKGRILTLPTLNVIGIITTPQQLERVNKLLDIVDADPFLHRGMRLFRLVNSKAAEVQAELDKILKALYGSAPPTYQVVALERINAILAIAPPNTGFNEVALWVEILDERSEESGEQVFIYKVRNLEAAKLASTLSDVFKIEDKKAAEEQEQRKRNEEAQQAPTSPQEEAEQPLPITPKKTPAGVLPVSAELKVNIVADESTNSLLIRANPRDYRQLLETIYILDQVPKEVMINVVFAEITLTEATKFGIDWHTFFGDGHFAVGSNLTVPGGNFPLNSQENLSFTNLSELSGFTLGYISGGLNAILNMIATISDVRILSRPSILVRNNEEASINVGSNEPFLGSINRSSLTEQALSQDVQYKDTGITLKVTPRINEDGIINMKLYQEISQLGDKRTDQALQSFIQRKLETSIVVRDNNAIIMGGLIETRNNKSNQGIPILKDIPIIGSTLFSSTDDTETRIELALIIVPQIVNPEIDNRPLVRDFINRMQATRALLNDESVFVNEVGISNQSVSTSQGDTKQPTKTSKAN